MGLPAIKRKIYTTEEYFEISASREGRYEFEHGELVAMGRTTDTHSELALNMASALKSAVRGKGCKVYAETVSLEVEKNGKYYLPDVFLTCDDRDHKDRKIKRHPGLIVEVLSEESVNRDREIKFRAYLKIETLQYYLLVAQDQVRIEVFSKMEGKGWRFDYYESMEEVIPLERLGIEIRVADVYDEVELIPVEPEQEEKEKDEQ